MAETERLECDDPGIEPTEDGGLWEIPNDLVGGLERIAEWGLRVAARSERDRGVHDVARLIRRHAKVIRDRLAELEKQVRQPDPREAI